MNYAYGDELAIVLYVKNEIVGIAPTHDSPIIFLNSPNYSISEKFALINDYIDGLPFTVAHDDFDEYNMHVLAAPTCNYYEIGTTPPPLYVPSAINCKKLLMICIGLYLMYMNCSCMTCRCIGRELDFVIA